MNFSFILIYNFFLSIKQIILLLFDCVFILSFHMLVKSQMILIFYFVPFWINIDFIVLDGLLAVTISPTTFNTKVFLV